MNPEDLAKHTLPVFVTPVVNYLWPGSETLNSELRTTILAMEQSERSINRSNVGGWHSSLDFLDREGAGIPSLTERLWAFARDLMRQFSRAGRHADVSSLRIEGWANVLRYGQYHSVHAHPNALWSGAYYVTGNPVPGDAEDQPFSGRFELLDPRPGASLSYADSSTLYGRFLLNPQPGQMLVFPAWMQHQVHPFFGRGERITVAFNVLT